MRWKDAKSRERPRKTWLEVVAKGIKGFGSNKCRCSGPLWLGGGRLWGALVDLKPPWESSQDEQVIEWHVRVSQTGND